MKYVLKAYTIWEQGPRPKQEDSLFPKHNEVNDADRLFIVCDGMGGHDAGDVASQTVCRAMSSAILSTNPNPEGAFTDDDFASALSAAYDALDAKDTGAYKKMGTTLTFLKLHDSGATIAHIGDSRVYHVRPGKGIQDTQILFQTHDHSLVNDLVKIGELTPEEAKNSRQKNVITRAMQPNMERRSRADIYHTQDIRPGDFFMLCSDGILEQMEDENIQYIFSQDAGDALQKVKSIIDVTVNNHDNHTAILVEILDVIGKPVAPIVAPEPKRVNEQRRDDEVTSYDIPASRSKTDAFVDFMKKNNKLILGIAIGLACALVILLVGGLRGEKETKAPAPASSETKVPAPDSPDSSISSIVDSLSNEVVGDKDNHNNNPITDTDNSNNDPITDTEDSSNTPSATTPANTRTNDNANDASTNASNAPTTEAGQSTAEAGAETSENPNLSEDVNEKVQSARETLKNNSSNSATKQ